MKYLSWDRLILEHYVRFWSKPTEHFRFDLEHESTPTPIYVVEFGPPGVANGFVYATVGASRQAMVDPDPERQGKEGRMELFVYTDQPSPRVRTVLLGLATYPFKHNTYLGPGHLIPGTEGVFPGSPLTDVLIAPPRGEHPDFALIRQSDGHHVHPFWVIPLYRSERI